VSPSKAAFVWSCLRLAASPKNLGPFVRARHSVVACGLKQMLALCCLKAAQVNVDKIRGELVSCGRVRLRACKAGN
jgi:hypothetical protein